MSLVSQLHDREDNPVLRDEKRQSQFKRDARKESVVSLRYALSEGRKIQGKTTYVTNSIISLTSQTFRLVGAGNCDTKTTQLLGYRQATSANAASALGARPSFFSASFCLSAMCYYKNGFTHSGEIGNIKNVGNPRRETP